MRHYSLPLLFALALLAALLSPALPQSPTYHDFADQRSFLGIPHFWNVLSNLPFALAGFLGLISWRRATWSLPQDRWPWLVVALSGPLIALGSSYYHFDPQDATLFWDRLPMTLAFTSVFVAILNERIHPRAVSLLLPALLIGIASVVYWRVSGDLRFYALVQFFPILAIPLLMAIYPSRYSHSRRILEMLALYLAAKVLEAGDSALFGVLSFSGHSCKHAVAAIALYLPLYMLSERQPVPVK